MDQNRKLRVLQVNKLYYPYTGGIETVVRQIAEGLKEKTDMKVLVCQEKQQTVKEEINGVFVTRAGSFAMFGNLPLSLKFIKEFKKQAKDREILLFHMPYPIGDFAYLLSGIRNKKVLIWWHSDIVRQKKWMIVYRPLMEWFLKRADKIIVATKGHIEGSEFLKPYREKCMVIPFGICREIEQNSVMYLKKKESKMGTVWKEKRVRFLFIGRLVYYKGCDILLQAFEAILDAELVIGGSGKMEKEIRQFITEHQMSERVTLKKNLSDQEVMKAYQDCDILVLPSIARSEAFGLVQIEAMAYGKPVINTDLPSGVPYVSIHGETGLTVKPGDVLELRDAMEWMIHHPEEREEMGRKARKRVEQEYLSDIMIERLEKLFEGTGEE